MRIRSIRPEFWSSEDIAALDIFTRLLFIGLWSYVDDNGVGRDVEKLITADVFPLEDDPRDTLARVSEGLSRLSEGGQITRFRVDGKPYLHIAKWDTHQRVDKPAKARYPLPTRDDAVVRETVAEPSRNPRETVAPGEGEKGRRGEGKSTSSQLDGDFIRFWSIYPKKVDKGHAVKAWAKAAKKVDVSVIISAAERFARENAGGDRQFIANPATWLNGERWTDEPAQTQQPQRSYEAAPLPDESELDWDEIGEAS